MTQLVFQCFCTKKWPYFFFNLLALKSDQLFFQSFCTKKWPNFFFNLFALKSKKTLGPVLYMWRQVKYPKQFPHVGHLIKRSRQKTTFNLNAVAAAQLRAMIGWIYMNASKICQKISPMRGTCSQEADKPNIYDL